MMSENEYGKKSYEYALGAIKASSHPPLTSDQLRRLGETDLKGFSSLLDEFGWGRGIDGTLSNRIKGEFDYAVKFINEISPDRTLTDLLLFEEDAQNLKLFLKGRLINTDVSHLAVTGSLPIEIIRGSVKAGDFSLLGDEAAEELEGIEEETDPFIISSKADRAIFIRTLNMAKKKNNALYEMLIKYAEAKNIISEVRLTRMGYSAEKLDSLLLPVPFKHSSDSADGDEITAQAKSSIARAMYDLRSGEGFAPIAEYFFAKKTEAQTLRALLAEYEINSGGSHE